MKRIVLLFSLLAAQSLGAATLYDRFSDSFLVTDGARLRAFDAHSLQPQWSIAEIKARGLLTVDGVGHAATIDPTDGAVFFVNLRARTMQRQHPRHAVLAAALCDGELLYTTREDTALHALSVAGAERKLAEVGAESSLLARRGDQLVIYSRLEGKVTLLSIPQRSTIASFTTYPFASDLEMDARSIYLTIPRRAKIVVLPLDGRTKPVELEGGAVPVDSILSGSSNALSPGEIVIADPSSKRIWRSERRQTMSQAVGRGVVRGLLGLGLFGARSAAAPSGVDRLINSGNRILAYDTVTSTLFRVEGAELRPLLHPVAFSDLGWSDERVVYWNESQRRLESVASK